MCAYKLRPRPLCAQEKERSEMKGHEAREDMKRKKKKRCVKGKLVKNVHAVCASEVATGPNGP